MGVLNDFMDIADTLVRLPFWLLIEAILANRYYPILKPISLLSGWMSSMCKVDLQQIPPQLFISFVLFTCSVAVVMQTSALLAFIGFILISMSVLGNALVYYAMFYYESRSPFQRFLYQRNLTETFCAMSVATLFLVLVLQRLLAYPGSVSWKRIVSTIFSLAAIPVMAYGFVVLFSFGDLVMWDKSNLIKHELNFCQTWIGLKSRHCPVDAEPVNSILSLLLALLLGFTYFFTIMVCLPFNASRQISVLIDGWGQRIGALGLFTFLSSHWDRLNMSRTLAFFWSFKIILVITLGPTMWSILPPPIGTFYEGPESADSQLPNISFLHDYLLLSHNQSTLSVLLTRLCVGTLVHGSETWLTVFGAAAFFGGLGIIIVNFMVLILDPSGEGVQRIRDLAVEAPVDVRDWNAIDDPDLGVHQNDVQALEMLLNTGWNCAILFLFLAFQYDLPGLPLTQRVYCSLYGMIVMLITCVHPVQALIKSLLLHLNVPGHGSTWFSHIRPLCTCVLLIGTCITLLAYVPNGLVDKQLIEENSKNDSQRSSSPDAGSHMVRLYSRFAPSTESMRIRQFRLFICAGQLVLSLLTSLIEYAIYQRFLRQPNWNGFRTSLFRTKLVTYVLDYLLSLLSFLTVCWLTAYDSFGVCRVLIICCYFHFILYPSTYRAYTWLRWKIFAERRLKQLASPTDQQLTALGENCPICYSEMDSNTAKMTRCGHLYHTACLTLWMARQLFCPICHSDLLSSSVKDLRRPPSPTPPHPLDR